MTSPPDDDTVVHAPAGSPVPVCVSAADRGTPAPGLDTAGVEATLVRPAERPEAGAELAAAFARAVHRQPALVAEAAASLHRPVHDEDALADLLHRAAEVAVSWMPQVDHAGITVQLDGAPFTVAGTDLVVLEVDALQYELDDGPCLQAMRTETVVSADATGAHARWPRFAEGAREHGVHSFLAAPLLVEGVGRGSINLYGGGTDGFPAGQTDLVAVLSAYVGRGLSDYAALRSARKQAEQMQEALAGRAPIEQAKGILMAVHQISADEAFDRLRSQSQRTNTKLRDLAMAFVAQNVGARGLDPGADPVAAVGPSWSRDFRSTFDHAPTGMAVASTAGVLLHVNGALTRLLGSSAERLTGTPLQELCHPEDREVVGAACAALDASDELSTVLATRVRNGRGGWVPVTLSMAEVLRGDGSVAHVVVHVEDVSVHQALNEELRRQALHDPLTGLPNRLLFAERLHHGAGRHRRASAPLSLLFCDVDEFTGVNDAHGHLGGDAVLVAVAQRLRASLRPGDTAARLGGDEFAVLCENTDAATAATIAERLARILSAPTDVHGHPVVVTVSIGAATSTPGEPPDPMALWRAADLAMYAVKTRRPPG